MRTQHEPKLRPRMQRAIEELKHLVREHYPDATFSIERSPDNPRVIHLVATVDVPDTTEVADVVIDRMMQLQIEDKLPLFIIPVQPKERVLQMLREQEEARAERVTVPPLEP